MTASGDPEESTGESDASAELAEVERALEELAGVLRARAAPLREFREAAQDSALRVAEHTAIASVDDAAALQVQLEAEMESLADRLRPVSRGLTAIAPQFELAVSRFDAAVRSLVSRLAGGSLPARQQSEADEALDGVLMLVPLLSERPWAEPSAVWVGDSGNPNLRAVREQFTSAFTVFDDQQDVIIALAAPILALPGRQLPPGAPEPGRPATAPELLAAEAAAARWFNSLQVWSTATHAFYVAAAAAHAQKTSPEVPVDRAAGMRRLAAVMTPATDPLPGAAADYAGSLKELDMAARVLLGRLTSGDLSGPDKRKAVSLLNGLGQFADGMSDVADDGDPLDAGTLQLGELAGSDIDASLAAVTSAFEMVKGHAAIIAGWRDLLTHPDAS